MESRLIRNVVDLLHAARIRDPIVMPATRGACAAETSRIVALFQQALAQGYRLERYADPQGPDKPMDLARASVDLLLSTSVGIYLDE
jgi:hypothetical protein